MSPSMKKRHARLTVKELYQDGTSVPSSFRKYGLSTYRFSDFDLSSQEGLALSFEAMNLIEDALIQYDELEAAFFQAMKGTVAVAGRL